MKGIPTLTHYANGKPRPESLKPAFMAYQMALADIVLAEIERKQSRRLS
jgi:hypothetical protein